MAIVETASSGVKIYIKVVPNASRKELSGVVHERLKVHGQAPPESEKANIAVCSFIAKALGLKKIAVTIS
ncbi:MAG: DUF167 domain-containing protein [Phycisphaerales bacterium]|nr:DUF167 domain-containing protein [Phycisphaerales bacterium]